MNISQHIFREYDIRGNVGTELNEEFSYLLGCGYAVMLKDNNKKNIAIGWDCRLSSEGYARALARGLSDNGIDVILTGLGPTPQLYYAIFRLNTGAGIQVTGSHNPPEMNGFKICLGTQTISGTQLQELKRNVIVASENKHKSEIISSDQPGKITEFLIRDNYIEELVKNSLPHMGKRKLKVVVDAGNGVGGLVGPQVLRALGVEVVELFCEPDGNFPNHHPDPTEIKNIQELIKRVKEEKADLGIGWDGDADRIGVVDQRGEVIFGDMLLLIYGRSILKDLPGATIIGDVKCSSLLFDDLRKRGANPIMWKTGHSLIKGKLKEVNGDLAGEMSGHIFFKHRYYGFDDAIYSSARLVEIVSNINGTISSLLEDLPKMVSTPEIRVDCREDMKFKITEKAKEAFSNYKVDTLDGARISFERGWGLVRASNTQPILVLRFEAETNELLEEYKNTVISKVDQIQRQFESLI